MGEEMIVKVQISLNSGVRSMLIYDRTRKYRYEGPLTNEIAEAMKGRRKAYFNATINFRKQFVLKNITANQSW